MPRYQSNQRVALFFKSQIFAAVPWRGHLIPGFTAPFVFQVKGAMLDEVMNDTSPEMERMVARRLYVGELPEAAFAEWNA